MTKVLFLFWYTCLICSFSSRGQQCPHEGQMVDLANEAKPELFCFAFKNEKIENDFRSTYIVKQKNKDLCTVQFDVFVDKDSIAVHLTDVQYYAVDSMAIKYNSSYFPILVHNQQGASNSIKCYDILINDTGNYKILFTIEDSMTPFVKLNKFQSLNEGTKTYLFKKIDPYYQNSHIRQSLAFWVDIKAKQEAIMDSLDNSVKIALLTETLKKEMLSYKDSVINSIDRNTCRQSYQEVIGIKKSNYRKRIDSVFSINSIDSFSFVRSGFQCYPSFYFTCDGALDKNKTASELLDGLEGNGDTAWFVNYYLGKAISAISQMQFPISLDTEYNRKIVTGFEQKFGDTIIKLGRSSELFKSIKNELSGYQEKIFKVPVSYRNYFVSFKSEIIQTQCKAKREKDGALLIITEPDEPLFPKELNSKFEDKIFDPDKKSKHKYTVDILYVSIKENKVPTNIRLVPEITGSKKKNTDDE